MDRLAKPLPRRRALAVIGTACAVPVLSALPTIAAAADETYDQESVLEAATDFFGNTTEGLAKVVERVFAQQGRPNAYIQGEETAAALAVGVVYGDGELLIKSGPRSKVYWAGPSIGFDLGANASKVFTLAYHLPSTAALFERFPGVDGSLYYIGGAGVTYQRRDGITLAPIRLGVGLRTGASIGYVHYRREKPLIPL